MRAMGELIQPRDPAANLLAGTAALRRALADDPDYALAHAMLGLVYTWRSLAELNISGLRGRRQARKHMGVALRHEPDNSLVLTACAEIALHAAGDIDQALALLERAIALNPNDANGLAMLGHVRRMAGDDPVSALALIEQAMRLSPRDPRTALWLQHGAWCHWRVGDFDAMQEWARESAELYAGNPFAWVALTCALALGGREPEAKETAAVIRDMLPSFSGAKFYWIARLLYGRRFPGATRDGYRKLREILQQAHI